MRSYRYSWFQNLGIRIHRLLSPSINSPYTIGPVDDICSVYLVPPEKMQSFFEDCIKRLRALKGDDIGDYLEFGVFNGASLSSAYTALKRLNISNRVFGFDGFAGLPPESESEDDGVWKKGFYSCSFEQLEECLKRKGINPDEMYWVKGWYKDTLTPDTAKKHNITNPGIVFVDCDTYSSSKSVLDFVAPLIKRPVIICLDDWRLNDLDVKGLGEYKSFNEFLEVNTRFKAEEIPSYKRNSRSFLIIPA